MSLYKVSVHCAACYPWNSVSVRLCVHTKLSKTVATEITLACARVSPIYKTRKLGDETNQRKIMKQPVPNANEVESDKQTEAEFIIIIQTSHGPLSL